MKLLNQLKHLSVSTRKLKLELITSALNDFELKILIRKEKVSRFLFWNKKNIHQTRLCKHFCIDNSILTIFN